MKKLLALILFTIAFVCTGSAQVTITGFINTPDTLPTNGKLYFALSQQADLNNGCGGPTVVVPTPVAIPIVNGQVSGIHALYGLDCITPSGLYYKVTYVDNNGNIAFVQNWTCIVGASVDIGTCSATATPATSSIFGQLTATNGTFTNATINSGAISNLANVTSYNGIGLAANGIPIIVAKYDGFSLSSNLGTTSMFSTGTLSGTFRVDCYAVVTQAATSSSTLPGCFVGWTDFQTNVSVTSPVFTSSPSTNTLGTNSGGSIVINAKASSTISVATSGYATSGATSMLYSVHYRLTYIGN